MHINNVNTVALALLSTLAAPAVAFWRLPCKTPIVVERADPVISPGKPSGHVHTIMGGNGFSFTMDYASTQSSTCSSCTVIGDKSNYWVPTLYYHAQNGSFISVDQTGGATVYYEQRATYPGKTLQAFPEGFRMVAGNPMLRNFTDTEAQDAVRYACLNYNGPATPETNAFPTVNCPSGLRAEVYFPSCWDGVNLDSADHKSHMAYPVGGYDHGTCPDSHPQPLISLFYEVIWNTPDFANDWYGSGQPFVWSMGDATGYGYHGDFVNGWDVNLLQEAVDQCTSDSGKVEDCPVFKLTPDSQAEGCMIGVQVDEPTQGVLSALPGCNQVTTGPGQATPGGACGATTTISAPAPFFKDLTSSLHWYYAGCGSDGIGGRTLTGPSQTLDNMTVETCVDFCISQGYSIAGTEYVTQCYCGNSVPSAAAPIAGLVGACTDKCGGDDTEYCGGYGAISLYEKCGSTCQNAEVGGPSGSSTTSASSSVGTTASAASSSSGNIVTSSNKVAAASTTAATALVSSVAPSSTIAAAVAIASSLASNVTLPVGWKAYGCYSDNLNPRSLGFNGWWDQPVTSSGCTNFCNANGYSIAGTENAGQCFCGNELLQSTQQPSSACNMVCLGDQREICGGSGTLSVFSSGQLSSRKARRAHKHRRGEAHHLDVMS